MTIKKTNTKRKFPTRIKPKPQDSKQEAAVIPTKTFHETFPVTLEFKEGKEIKRCYFVCKEHCDSYLKRYKMKKNTYKIFDTLPREK